MSNRHKLWSLGGTLGCAMLLLVLCVQQARAEDTVSTRVDAGVSAGPHLLAWDFGYGASWDGYVVGGVLRLGGVLGLLSYPKEGWPALLTVTPEISYHFGKETDQRLYFTAQLPLRVMTLDAKCVNDRCQDRILGARGGVELEQRKRALGVRGRIGLFLGALQRTDGVLGFAASLRFVLELGRPVVPPPPPLPPDRICPDGVTPINPVLPCPPSAAPAATNATDVR